MIIEKPNGTHVDDRVAGCFCVEGKSVLVIQRQRHKPFALHWAIPSGKLEHEETARECIVRELREEIGLEVNPNDLKHLSCAIIDQDGSVFEYVSFVLHLKDRPQLTIKRDEVRKVEWVPLSQIKKRRVIPYFYNTIHNLLDWEKSEAFQLSLLPAPEAKSAKHRIS